MKYNTIIIEYIKIFRKIYRRIIIKLSPMIAKVFSNYTIKNNKIVFDNFGGNGYGDNPKYIAEELIRRDMNVEMIWLVDNLSDFDFPKAIKVVKINSIRALYELSTAKIWINNIRSFHPVRKKDNQIYLQTWHAPFSPKKLEKEAENTLSRQYVKAAKYDGSISDAIMANSWLQEMQYKKSFWLNEKCEILKFGLPRNDYLANSKNNCTLKEEIRKKIGLQKDVYYILYAPTFRDDFSIDGYKIDFDSVLEAFEYLTHKKCSIIVRLHPNVAKQSSFVEYNDWLINGSMYPDIQELSIATDCVISDYSTSIFDFALINKPAFICALDLEDYKQKRGLLKEFDEFPFPSATTNDELIENIKNFDRKTYDEKIQEYFTQYPVYDKGNAAKQTVDWIADKLQL